MHWPQRLPEKQKMKWHKRITEEDQTITISMAFQFSKTEALGAYDASDDRERTTLSYLEDLEDPLVFIAFLRIYVFWVEIFNLSIKPKKRRKKK